MNLFKKQKTDSWTKKTNLRLPKGKRDKLGVWVEHIHTQISSVQSLSRVRLFATP